MNKNLKIYRNGSLMFYELTFSVDNVKSYKITVTMINNMRNWNIAINFNTITWINRYSNTNNKNARVATTILASWKTCRKLLSTNGRNWESTMNDTNASNTAHCHAHIISGNKSKYFGHSLFAGAIKNKSI